MTGVNPKSVYAGATAIAVAILGFAAVFQSLRATVAPADGPFQLIYAFEAVIIGGMGSIWGAFIGAMVLGVSQSIGFPHQPGIRNPRWPSGVPDGAGRPPAGPSGKGNDAMSDAVATSIAARPSPVVRVQRQTPSGTVAMVLGVGVLIAVVSMPWWATAGNHPRRRASSAATSRSRRCGTCWRAMAASSRSASRPSSACAAYTMFVMAQLWGINPFLAVVLCLVAPAILAVPTYCSAAPPRRPLFRHRHLGGGGGVPAGHLGLPLCEFRRRHEPARDDRLFGRRAGRRHFAALRASAARHHRRQLLASALALRPGADRDPRQSGRGGEPGRQCRPPALPHLDRGCRRHRACRGDLLHGAAAHHAALGLRPELGQHRDLHRHGRRTGVDRRAC